MRIHLFQRLLVLVASAGLLTAAACGDSGSKNDGPAVVTGHLDDDSGNQSVTPNLSGAASGDATLQTGVELVEVGTVDDTGAFHQIGEADVAADGSFRIDGIDLPAGEPLLVRGMASAGANVKVMGLVAASSADDRVVAPLSQETTVEAQTFLALIADGHSASSIDTASLMTWISAEVAVSASGDVDALADAFVQAQAAWTTTASGRSSLFDAQAAMAARADAWNALAVKLDAASSASAEASAWADYMAQIDASVATSAKISASVLADANAAAAMAFESQISSSLGAGGEGAARGVGAIISGHAALAAQRDAASGSDGSASVTTQLNTAYQAYFSGIRAASSTSAMTDAYASLAVALSGHGASQRDGSVLAALLTADGSATTAVQLEAAIAATAAASTTFETAAQAALAANDGDALGDAMVTFRAQTDAAIQTSITSASALRGFVSDLAVQLNGQANVQFGLEGVLTAVTDLGVTLSGQLLDILGLQTGADGLVDGLTGAVVADAASAAVVRLDATTGAMVTLATGVMTDANGHFSISDVDAAEGPVGIAFFDQGGALVAGTLLAGGVDGDADASAGPITQETTVELQVVAALIASGVSYDDIDVADVFASVDAAVAASAQSEDQVAAVAAGIMVAQRTRADALGATLAEMHDATLQAAVDLQAELGATTSTASEAYTAFEAQVQAAIAASTEASASEMARAETRAQVALRATVEAIASASSTTSAAIDARARLDNALSLETSLDAMFSGMSEISATRNGELSAAVEAFASATAAAQDRAGLDAAGAAFEDAVLGFGSVGGGDKGLLGGILGTDLSLSVALQATIEAAFDAAFQAAATWHAAVQTGVAASTSGGEVDASAAVQAVATASATYDAAVETALALEAATELSAAEHDLLLELGAQVAAGLYAD